VVLGELFRPAVSSTLRYLMQPKEAAVSRSERAEQAPIMVQPLGEFSHNWRHKIRSDYFALQGGH
jgi:hypothetical protein